MPSTEQTAEITLRLNDKFTKQVQKGQKQFSSFGKSAATSLKTIAKGVTSLKAALAGFVAFLAVRRAFRFFSDIAKDLDFIVKTSDRLGITTSSLQELTHVAELAGVEFASFATGLGIFAKNVDSARRSMGPMRDSFRDLGIDINNLPIGDGGKLDVIELLKQTADGFNRLDDSVRGSAALLTVYGDAGKNLGVVVRQGSAAIEAQADQFERLTGILSVEELQRASQYQDAITRLGAAFDGITRQLFVDFAPTLATVFEKFTILLSENRDEIVGFFRTAANAAIGFADIFSRTIIGMIELIDKIPGIQLIDEDALRAQIKQLEKLRSSLPTGFDRRNEEREKLGFVRGADPEERTRIRKGTEIAKVRRGESLFSPEVEAAILSDLSARDAITEQIKPLTTALNEGVGGLLRAGRDKLVSDFVELRKQFEGTTADGGTAGGGGGGGGGSVGIDPTAIKQQTDSVARDFLLLQDVTSDTRKELLKLDADAQKLSFATRLEKLVAAGALSIQQFETITNLTSSKIDSNLQEQQDAITDFGAAFNLEIKSMNAEMQTLGDVGRETARTLRDSFVDGAAEMGSAFADSSEEGKRAFEGFKKSVIKALIEIALKAAALKIVQIVASAIGTSNNAKGGVSSGTRASGNLEARGFADGGVVTRPTLAVFGEGKKKEAFVPLPDGRAIPAVVTDDSSGTVIQNLNVNFQFVDPRGAKQFFDTNEDRIIRMILEAVSTRTRVKEALKAG